jgi:uncharacterized protein YqgV (UPF0045/DUF77 family)
MIMAKLSPYVTAVFELLKEQKYAYLTQQANTSIHRRPFHIQQLTDYMPQELISSGPNTTSTQ